MSKDKENVDRTISERLAPSISAVGISAIAVWNTIQLSQFFATNPLTVWIAVPLNGLLFFAFGYWFGTCKNLDDVFRTFPSFLRKFIPRFSVRTMAIFVSAVCVYFGAWEATKKYGMTTRQYDDVGSPISEHSPLPFVVVQLGWFEGPRASLSSPFGEISLRRRLYLWLLGPRVKLPFELNVDISDWKEF